MNAYTYTQNTDKMDKFLKIYKMPKMTPDWVENLNRPKSTKEPEMGNK